METSRVYLLTGGVCSGKTALALWLCRRLPGPTAGLQQLCTGRCGAGALFSARDLTTGQVMPLDQETETRIVLRPEALPWAARVLEAARQAGTLLVDEAQRFAADDVCRRALAAAGGTVVLTAPSEAGDWLATLYPASRVERLDLTAQSPETLRRMLAQTLPAPLHAGVSVRLFREEKCFGPGPLQLLELVGRTGSLHRAAAAMGMAYSKAWKMLGALEVQWGFAMLERRPGGAGGGGSLLTPGAWDLLARYRALQWETEQAARRAFARQFGQEDKSTDCNI